jgi:hypothetical protein
MSRWLAYGFGVGMVALVAAPGFGDPDADSYPFSTYPMFARPRDKPWLTIAEGVDAQGRALRLPPSVVAHDEVMQAAATLRRAVQGGPVALERLCAHIAGELQRDAAHGSVRQVRIVGARFDPLRYFSEGPLPEAREVYFACPVPERR